jgi:hypothetical protein
MVVVSLETFTAIIMLQIIKERISLYFYAAVKTVRYHDDGSKKINAWIFSLSPLVYL